MSFINIEIKAKISSAENIRKYLLANGADFRGTDNQVDTYFNVHTGRLKLRQGNIENTLIFYERNNQAGPKQSDCKLIEVAEGRMLLEILKSSLGILVEVKKKREIYFIDNIKIHIDTLNDIGYFVEIEASNKFKDIPVEELYIQCNDLMTQFNISPEDLIEHSYSDMILELKAQSSLLKAQG